MCHIKGLTRICHINTWLYQGRQESRGHDLNRTGEKRRLLLHDIYIYICIYMRVG